MFIANATGCSSIWGNPAGTSRRTRSTTGGSWPGLEQLAVRGQRRARSGHAARSRGRARASVKADTEALIDDRRRRRRAAPSWRAQAWLAALDDADEASKTTAAAYVEQLEKIAPDNAARGGHPREPQVPHQEESFWIFGGDGWAYDIGYGGLDHVHRIRRGRERLRLRHRGLLQHGRPGLQGIQHRPGRAVRGGRQGHQEEEPRRDRNELRLRLRGAGRHGRQACRRPSRPSPRPRPTTARRSSSATAPARCTPSRAAWPTASSR